MRVFLRTLLISLVLVIPLIIWLAPQIAALFFGMVFFLAPLWLPVLLFFILVPLWITYVRSQYVSNIPYTVLELKPGPDTPKTARAMELVFYSLYHRTTIPPRDALLLGMVRMPWAFELYAHNGKVRFFMRIPTAHRVVVESRIRSEYRDIDIDEVNDFMRTFAFDPLQMRLEAREFALTKPDPYPIKTYEVYEGEKKPRDLLVEVVEKLASVSDKEHFLVSFIVRPHQSERTLPWDKMHDSLQQSASTEIGRLVGPGGDVRGLPENKKKIVAAMEEALKKPSFDVGARVAYIADRAAFDTARSGMVETFFEPFSDHELNGFVPHAITPKAWWPLSDILSALPQLTDMRLFDFLRRRAFFAPPYYGKPFILNTAELATVFHIPHVSRSSPLGGKDKLEPPDNLPHERIVS